jgi:hypothetical protein
MSLYGGIDLHANNSVIVLIGDFSVVLFQPHFMLISEEHPMKLHKNQWLVSLLSPPISLVEPRTRAHTMVSGVQTLSP